MKVVYTSDIFDRQRVGGISRYFVELFVELAALGADVVVETGRGRNVHLADALARLPALKARCVRRAGRAVGGVGAGADRQASPPLFHQTYFGLRESAPAERRIATIHDLVDERFGTSPRAKLRARFKRRAVARAACAVAVSEATRRDAIERWGLDERRVRVIHHGVRLPEDASGVARDAAASGSIREAAEAALPGSGPDAAAAEPFVLFVGRREGYKNFAALVRALGQLRRRGLEPLLVAAGGGPLGAGERRLIEREGLARRIVQRAVTDAELDALYREAHALVCPSLYEGFGLPVLEAMARGCCVCCANAASLPEVAGDAAAYFEPAETDSIAAALESVLTDDVRRRALGAAGRARAARFTWRASAEQHLALYRELAAEAA